MRRERRGLVVIADDFGAGAATNRGIAEASAAGSLSATVLLVNGPAADHAAGLELAALVGWHPNLTTGRPVSDPASVPDLVRPSGEMGPLPRFLRRALVGAVPRDQVRRELAAQLARFVALTGHLPEVVTTHHHVGIFPPVGDALRQVLREANCRPWLRRVREPWPRLRLPGERIKRVVLGAYGRREARRQAAEGLPGADWLEGIGSPTGAFHQADFFERRLPEFAHGLVELMCHPGHPDDELRRWDPDGDEASLAGRPGELRQLLAPSFRRACESAGWPIVSPGEFLRSCRAA
jgi:predicted glycoside hydrolase/deacetylase ChbG (UPF0249 family)